MDCCLSLMCMTGVPLMHSILPPADSAGASYSCHQGYLNALFTPPMNNPAADVQNKRLSPSMPVSSGVSQRNGSRMCRKACVTMRTGVAPRSPPPRGWRSSQGASMMTAKSAGSEMSWIPGILLLIVPNRDHKQKRRPEGRRFCQRGRAVGVTGPSW